MDTNRLRYFCAIVESGSLKRASELLHISSPALSKAMRVFEEELGTTLFTRVGRSLEVTDQGKVIARRGREILREVEKLQQDLETQETRSREIKIATFEVFSTYFLEALKHLPWENLPLVLHEVIPGELERALIDEKVDIGITYLPVPHPELDFLKVTTIEMGVFAAKNFEPNKIQSELPFVVPVMPIFGSPSRVRGLDGWPDDAYPRKIKYQVTLMESALEICRQGRAAGYFPLFVVELHNRRVREEFRLLRRPSVFPGRVCKTDVFIVKRRSDLENPLIKQLGKAIRLTCRV